MHQMLCRSMGLIGVEVSLSATSRKAGHRRAFASRMVKHLEELGLGASRVVTEDRRSIS